MLVEGFTRLPFMYIRKEKEKKSQFKISIEISRIIPKSESVSSPSELDGVAPEAQPGQGDDNSSCQPEGMSQRGHTCGLIATCRYGQLGKPSYYICKWMFPLRPEPSPDSSVLTYLYEKKKKITFS